jgi:tripartite-type tricarboxylate transporter receptor subunit TctC
MDRLRGLIVALVLGLPSVPALAQQEAWPARAVRLIVPSSPGGGSDIYARLLAQGLSQSLRQQFVVDNRPGAGGIIGAEIAARSAPDGYTFLAPSSPVLITNPSLYRKLPYDAERDFVVVARGALSPQVIVSHPSLPVKSLPELIALGKRLPEQVAYGSAGVGGTGNLLMKIFEERTGARFLHLPYKGLGAAIQGLLRGETAFMSSGIVVVLPHVRQGRVRALAVTYRSPQLPGVPTLAESGFPNVEASGTYGVVAPAGTPHGIVQRLSAEIARLMKEPAFREKLDAHGLIPVFDTPEEAAASLRREREMWAEVIRRNRIVVD